MIAEVVAASKENPYLVEAIKKATKATEAITGDKEETAEARGETTGTEKDSGKVDNKRRGKFGTNDPMQFDVQ